MLTGWSEIQHFSNHAMRMSNLIAANHAANPVYRSEGFGQSGPKARPSSLVTSAPAMIRKKMAIARKMAKR